MKNLIQKIKIKLSKIKNKKKILVICLSAFVAICAVITIIFVCNANSLLSKVNYESKDEAVTLNEEANNELDEKESIDLKITQSTDVDDEKETTKSDASSESSKIKYIYEVKNGKSTKMEISDKEIEQKASEIQEEADKDIEENLEDKSGVWYSEDVYNFLIIGYDAGADEAVMFEGMQYPRSDCNIIVSVNKKTKTINLVSLSRATYVAIEGHGNKRLNTAYAYGKANKLIETIENNYKIRIDDYASCDFSGFKNIVNAMDGFSLKLSKPEASFVFNKEDTAAGTYKLNGSQALRYVRLREIDSDRQRTGRQRKALQAMFTKLKGLSLTEDIDFLQVVFPYLTTNLAKTEMVFIASQMQSYSKYPIKEDIIPHNAIKLTMRDGKEVIILDWDETTEYVHEVLYSGAEVKTIKK